MLNSIFAQKVETDKSVKPQEDFYKFANGLWLKKTEIPASENRWGSFNELGDNNRKIVKEILEKSAANTKASKGSLEQMIGDLFASGMDSVKRDQQGIQPIQNELDMINQIKNSDDVYKTIARHQVLGISTVFSFFVGADAKNSKMNIIQMGQGGTSLPDRSYYLENNERFEKYRKEYLSHISKMFELSGEKSENASRYAQIILKMETRMAESQRSRVDLRNPQKRYNKLSLEQLGQMTFNIDWKKYFESLNLPKAPETLIVGQPEYLAMADRMIKDIGVEEWKIYFKWKTLRSAAPILTNELEKENFRFNGTILSGTKEMQPRWRRISQVVDGSLGDALGQLYVQKAYPAKAKAKMAEMIENIREAFADRIKSLSWMGEETKQQALKKLNAIVYKIGHTEKWKDYAGVEIKRDDFFGNLKRIREYDYKRILARIDQAVDKTEWGMTPPTVNAYYSPTNNEIVFPAGILQPPFFDFNADDALNYGGIGAVIGHEITHGFDDQGSQYDAEGNLKMWWTKEDRSKFEALANKLVEQYNSYTVLDTVHLNGRLTLGENIADLGGLTIAYDALQRSFKKNGRPKNIDGMTPEQRFFYSWARIWKQKARNETSLQLVKTDPHSPGEYRANGVVSNMPAFFEAFGIKEGDKMKNKEVLSIW